MHIIRQFQASEEKSPELRWKAVFKEWIAAKQSKSNQ